jgi:DDE superfamily endonuclease
VLSPAAAQLQHRHLIGVLDQLAAFYAGQRVVLIWDGLSAHWSTKMRAWLDSQRDWLCAERLPAYAPELNPVEGLWANLKDLELANLPTTTLVEVADAAHQGIQRVCKHEGLVVGFLAHTGLTLDMNRQPNPRNSIRVLGVELTGHETDRPVRRRNE